MTGADAYRRQDRDLASLEADRLRFPDLTVDDFEEIEEDEIEDDDDWGGDWD